jgi:hypothetical protein
MAADLALNRVDHDLVWHLINPPPTSEPKTEQVPKYEIWLIDSADKVAQQIKINLLSLLGEWFLDDRYGVPYLEEILIKNPRMSSVETILRNHISSVPNVLRITSFGLGWNRQMRTLSVEFACDTDLGPIEESVKLEVFPRV